MLEQHETLKRKPSFMTMLDESAAAAGVGSPTDSDGFLYAAAALKRFVLLLLVC